MGLDKVKPDCRNTMCRCELHWLQRQQSVVADSCITRLLSLVRAGIISSATTSWVLTTIVHYLMSDHYLGLVLGTNWPSCKCQGYKHVEPYIHPPPPSSWHFMARASTPSQGYGKWYWVWWVQLFSTGRANCSALRYKAASFSQCLAILTAFHGLSSFNTEIGLNI